MFKVCKGCDYQKLIQDFDKDNTKTDGLQSTCRECHKRLGHEHYIKYKTQYNARKDAAEKRNKDYINEFKNKPCLDCGIRYPSYIMHLDHIPERGKKEFGLSAAKSRPIQKVKDECDKCEVVCSNCHGIRTHNRKEAQK